MDTELNFGMAKELDNKLNENAETLLFGLLRVCPGILTHWDFITEPGELLFMLLVLKLLWQGFGSRETAGVRSCQKLPTCPTEPIPACFKREPPLAKSKQWWWNLWDSRFKKRGEKLLWNGDCSQKEAGVCVRNSSADTIVSGERGGGGGTGTRGKIPLPTMVQIIVRKVSPCSPCWPVGRTDFHNRGVGRALF